jgi:putative hemolysin
MYSCQNSSFFDITPHRLYFKGKSHKLESSIFLQIIAIFILIIFSGFFSGSETALFSLSLIQRERLKKGSNKKNTLIYNLLSNPRELIITILMGNDMINITASVIAANLFVSLLGIEHGRWAAIAVMTPITLIFAEIIPKTLFVVHNERIAPYISIPVYWFSKFITPLRWIFDRGAGVIIKMLGIGKHEPNPPVMEEDFLDMVDLSHEDGELHLSERDLIHNVFEFSDKNIFEVMTPIEKMFTLPHDMETTEIIKQVKGNLHSRVPVYKTNPDNIAGILYAKDLLKVDLKKLKGSKKLLPLIWRKPYFVSEGQKVDRLFYILKEKRIHMVMCMNEKGKISGVVTMEDLLEELFGEIYDEHEPEGI